ncbi:hypothetical protein ACJRO7_033971 [Eucalyptus globulus]|uniref:Alginate lyase 2 domain-containing protein n=1 Tax=Eucalyptus globulus TaxID=34317 RepID=A0ABD3J2A3_EUCGL
MSTLFFSKAKYTITIIIHLIILVHRSLALSGPVDPTQGFVSLPFNRSYYHIQKPYDVPEDQRYSFSNGIHKCWVYSTDKPHSLSSRTEPRTEIAIQLFETTCVEYRTHLHLICSDRFEHHFPPYGYGYSSGVWQFEGYGYVPTGTSGVCIMQVFGASPHATTLMLRVYNGSLMYYRSQVLIEEIYDEWFRLNVIHDVDGSKVKVYIDGYPVLETDGRGGTSHAFKCGVYAQNDDSFYMESRWRHIKVLRKSD